MYLHRPWRRCAAPPPPGCSPAGESGRGRATPWPRTRRGWAAVPPPRRPPAAGVEGEQGPGGRRWTGGGARPARPRGAAPPRIAAASAREHTPITMFLFLITFTQVSGKESEGKLL